MEGLLILLLFPFAWPFIAKRIWHSNINWTEMTVQIFVVSFLTWGVWATGKYGQTLDTEIWNGYITDKQIVDGHYERAYDCNCRSERRCSGSGKTRSCSSVRVCQTCYEDRYTRKWIADSTLGGFSFGSVDYSSRMRRNATEPPQRYLNCRVGEPASAERSYTNYVQAVPSSLFHDASASVSPYQDKVPAYPRVYDYYRINRVVGDLANHPTAKRINQDLNEALKTLGKEKQANIVVILTDIDDSSYRHVVERAWLGGEKNDIIVIVGLNGNKITWSDTITWALNKGNELFNVKMRDGVRKLGTLDPNTFSPFVVKTIRSTFDRPEMAQFKYLESEIDPPTWVIIFAIIIAIGGSLLGTFLSHKYEMEDIIGDLFRGKHYG